jgi:hypothetical protein
VKVHCLRCKDSTVHEVDWQDHAKPWVCPSCGEEHYFNLPLQPVAPMEERVLGTRPAGGWSRGRGGRS